MLNYDDTRQLNSNPDHHVVKNVAHGFPADSYPHLQERTIDAQFRYVVHRQAVGHYTPVVFDVRLYYVELEGNIGDISTTNAINRFFEPFVNGALFMNHESPFILDLLKGQEAGYNRKEMIEKIKDEIHGQNHLWYSNWLVPSPTRQNQKVVVYDMDCACSMRDPAHVVSFLIELITRYLGRDTLPFHTIYYAAITAGYTQKVS